jgi:ribonuclease HII
MRRVKLTLANLRRRYVERGRPLPADVEAELRADARPGARAILDEVKRRRRSNRSEGQRLRKMLRYERSLWDTGATLVCGIDEAGMSPLAGPVAAAAVVLPVGARIAHVDDSKRLSPAERERLAPEIRRVAVAWGVGVASVEEIDSLNIYWAGLLAMRRALVAIPIVVDHVLIDGRKLAGLTTPQTRIVHGDAKSLSIAAASILAKTTRDRIMTELDRVHPGYGFAKHKGYPVREHFDALRRLGACAIHRRSFEPVREALTPPFVHGT